jgi:hypothetical protein
MMIFGAGKYLDRFPRYLVLLIACHAALLAPVGLFLWMLSEIFGRRYFAESQAAFAGMALASALILLFWLMRRVFYVLMKPAWGVLSSLLYLAALAAVVTVLSVRKPPSSLWGWPESPSAPFCFGACHGCHVAMAPISACRKSSPTIGTTAAGRWPRRWPVGSHLIFITCSFPLGSAWKASAHFARSPISSCRSRRPSPLSTCS